MYTNVNIMLKIIDRTKAKRKSGAFRKFHIFEHINKNSYSDHIVFTKFEQGEHAHSYLTHAQPAVSRACAATNHGSRVEKRLHRLPMNSVNRHRNRSVDAS